MNNFQWKSITPHDIAVGIFLVVAVIYYKPALEGKVLNQDDVVHWIGLAEVMYMCKETKGLLPLCNSNFFGCNPV